jgi:hypothetical protein
VSILSTLISGVGSIASIVYPPAAPVIGFIQEAAPFIEKALPYAEKAVPIIQEAIKDGPAAFAAAKAAAPEFMAQMSSLAANVKKTITGSSEPVTDAELAAVTAHVVGVDPPGWTHEETLRWWDRAVGDH